jgi:hypothetical protein
VEYGRLLFCSAADRGSKPLVYKVGWTNRILTDASIRFGTDAVFKRPWIVSHWLVSETPTAQGIRQRVKCAAARPHRPHAAAWRAENAR